MLYVGRERNVFGASDRYNLFFDFLYYDTIRETNWGGGILHFGKYSLQYYLNHIQTAMVAIAIVSRMNMDFPYSHYVEWLLIFALMVLFSYIALLIEKRFRILRFITGLKN